PHYEVPLAAVLEAYAEGAEDLKNGDLDLEEPEGCLCDVGARDEAEEAEEASVPAVPCPIGGVENARMASEPADLSPPDDHQQGEAEDSSHVENQQSQEFGNPGNLANSLEEKVMGESISSKKKEKRKHVDHVESSIFIAPGSVQSSDDLEEDTGDHKVLSRYLV
ncbi:unnamed protein product, partial [Gulo gulo]